jgi:hypothetical protein
MFPLLAIAMANVEAGPVGFNLGSAISFDVLAVPRPAVPDDRNKAGRRPRNRPG